MINITIPAIAVEKATNGWIVQWKKPNPEFPAKTAERALTVSGIALNNKQLLKLLEEAAADIEALNTKR